MKNTLITWGLRYRTKRTIKGTDLVTIARKAIDEGLPVTFDERYLDPGHKAAQDETPVKEIERVPVKVPKKYAGILEKRKPFDGDLDAYAKELKKAVKAHLRLRWDATRPTLVSHSAGYDSRIISLALMELRDEGFNLGDVHFRCHQPENTVFYQIMAAQGWQRDQYSGDEKLPESDHYDIGNTRHASSGWLPHFMSMDWWRDMVGNEKSWNFVSGLGGGEIFDYPARGMRLFKDWQWCENDFIDRWLNHFLYNHEWAGDLAARFNTLILPFFSYEYLALASQCRNNFIKLVPRRGGGYIDGVREAILKQFKPSTLNIGYGPGHRYEWGISAARQAEMMKFWEGSIFRAQHTPGKVIKPVRKVNGRWKLDTHDSKLWNFAVTWEHIHR